MGIVKQIGEHSIIGNSQGIRDVFGVVEKAARSDSTVMIFGESGTGKELIARALHQNSKRESKPFIAVNCGAIPDGLLESELFGYEKGAFTGASHTRIGRLELANEGTVFLDEIGDMPAALQVKLLRVLAEQEIDRLGGSKPVKVNVRFITATHRNIEDAIKEGKFREDLYYRLNVINIQVPPLRDRTDDIQLLTYFFVQKFNQEYSKNVRSISSEALELLQSQEWKENNVRQLENAINRAIVLCQADELGVELFNLTPGKAGGLQGQMEGSPEGLFDRRLIDLDYTEAKREVVEAFSKWYLEERLRETGWNITRAAEMSGQQRPNFRKLMTRFGIQVPSTEERQRQFKQN